MSDGLKSGPRAPFSFDVMIPLSVPPLGDRPARVLVVATCPDRRTELARMLEGEGHLADTLDPEEFLDGLRARPPDVVLLDGAGVGGTGLELLGDLRILDPVHLVPLVVLADPEAEEEDVARALLAGADDVITDPRRTRELSARIAVQLRNRRDRDLLRSTQRERSQLEDEAMTDALTGLGNRRAADRALRADAGSLESLLLMVVDVDHFKRVNDTWGHAVGDEVLRSLGRCLRRLARDGDDVSRYGGEEFLVVIRDAPARSHRAIAERFLRGIRSLTLPPGLGPPRITASIGAVSWEASQPVAEASTLFEAADRALYAAKRGGRDALVLSSGDEAEPRPHLVPSRSIA